MPDVPVRTLPGAAVLEESPVAVGGAGGVRYRLHRPHVYTGDEAVDRAISTFEAAVFLPPAAGAHTPIVIGLQGIGAPYQRSAFLASALVSAGIGCALFETPLSGSRGLRNDPSSNAALEVLPLVERGVRLDAAFAGRLFDGVAADYGALAALLAQAHGLRLERLALLGVSFGCLLSALAFMRDGVGARLLGIIGHPDVPTFARGMAQTLSSYSPLPLDAICRPGMMGLAEGFARRAAGNAGIGALHLACLLVRLGAGGAAEAFNPMTYADRVGPERPTAFFVGGKDTLARPDDAERCAARIAGARVVVDPAMGHGAYATSGEPFDRRVTRFVQEALADWAA